MPSNLETFPVAARGEICHSIADTLAAEFKSGLFSLGALACSSL
jgi:hypothetical protein